MSQRPLVWLDMVRMSSRSCLLPLPTLRPYFARSWTTYSNHTLISLWWCISVTLWSIATHLRSMSSTCGLCSGHCGTMSSMRSRTSACSLSLKFIFLATRSEMGRCSWTRRRSRPLPNRSRPRRSRSCALSYALQTTIGGSSKVIPPLPHYSPTCSRRQPSENGWRGANNSLMPSSGWRNGQTASIAMWSSI